METVSLYSEEGPLNKSRVVGASCVLSPQVQTAGPQVQKALAWAK